MWVGGVGRADEPRVPFRPLPSPSDGKLWPGVN